MQYKIIYLIFCRKDYEPKVLITYADNPNRKTRIFGRELTRIIPNSTSLYRNRSGVKKMVKSAIAKGFTDLIVVNEDQCKPSILFTIEKLFHISLLLSWSILFLAHQVLKHFIMKLIKDTKLGKTFKQDIKFSIKCQVSVSGFEISFFW